MQHLSTLDPDGATAAEYRLKSQYPDQRAGIGGLTHVGLHRETLPLSNRPFRVQLEEGPESALSPVTQGL
jgi:hypothetical protein